MADRVVRVRLSAQVAEYRKGMEEAAKATRDLGTEAQKLAQTRDAMQTVGRTGVAVGAAIAVGLGVAVSKFADFQQQMSYVAATGQDAKDSMDELRQAALDAGASTVFSATEAGGAIENLAKAGISSADILGGALTGSLDLAAAGGLGVAQAAEIAATTLQQFKLKGFEASHVADLLAAGAGKAMGDVTDMAQALNQGGLVAAQFGVSVEETVGTLSAFAQAGLLGSDAGTSFRTMLLRLANPTEEVKGLMKELGIEVYDSQGQFVGLSGLAGELETSLAGMTDEQKNTTLAMIFGQDAIRGANILLREGKDGIEEWTAAVDDQGYAADVASERLDNLKGDVEAFNGALDTALITVGSASDGPFRMLVQSVTEAVDAFNGLPSGAQQAVFWVGLVAAGASTAAGAFLLGVPKVAEYKLAIEQLGTGAQRTSRLLGALGRGVGVAAVAVTAVTIVQNLSEEITKNLLPSLEQIDNQTRTAASGVELFATALRKEGITNTKEAGKLLGELGAQLDAVANSDFWNPASISGTAATVADQLAQIAQSGDMDLFSAQFRKLAEDAGLTDKQLRTFIKTNPELQDALTKQASATGAAADAQSLLEIAMGEGSSATETQQVALEDLQGVATDTTDDVNALADAIRNFGSMTFDTERASIDFQQSLQDLSDTLTDGDGNLVGSLDASTQAGRDTLGAMLDVAQSTNDYAASVQAMGGSTEQVQGILEAGRQKIIDTRMALGDTEEQAKQYADQLVATPETIATQVQLTGVAAAEEALRTLTLPRTIQASLQVNSVGPVKGAYAFPDSANGNMFSYQAYANGGISTGIYNGRPGGIQKFAEPEVGWEAFISGKSSERNRNLGIWQETGRRLGVGQGGGESAAGPMSVSLAGATITATVDGRPLTLMIQEQIVATSRSNTLRIQNGRAG